MLSFPFAANFELTGATFLHNEMLALFERLLIQGSRDESKCFFRNGQLDQVKYVEPWPWLEIFKITSFVEVNIVTTDNGFQIDAN